MTNSQLKTHDSKLQFPPPWQLTGRAVMLLSARGAILLVHYESSPVGPYDEWARAVVTLRGPRVLEMLVTSADSRRGGRENWGFPKELAPLNWQSRGERIEFRGKDEIYRLRGFGPRLPIRAKFFCVQALNGENVRVPFEIEGAARLAWRGRQMAVVVEEFTMKVSAAQAL